jgi:hypothetical protein
MFRKRPTRPSPGDVVYDLRVAEAALRVIAREVEAIPSDQLGEAWQQIVNIDAAIGAWRRGFVAQPHRWPDA